MSDEMPDLRMEAYWYSFATTGNRQVDEILSAVACAGKAAQNTSYWVDEIPNHYGDHLEGLSPIAWIQNAAQRAASHVEAATVPKAEHDKVLKSIHGPEGYRDQISGLGGYEGRHNADLSEISRLNKRIDKLKAESVPRELVEQLIETAQEKTIRHVAVMTGHGSFEEYEAASIAQDKAIESIREQMNEQ